MLQFLVDTSPASMEELKGHPLVAGQLLTPLTQYRHWGGVYAIDNGAFSRFDRDKFGEFVRSKDLTQCLFVAMPDVVGSARRTLEAFYGCMIGNYIPQTVKRALVIQDGIEDLGIPWPSMSAIFIGGTTEFKMSQAAADVVKTALILGKHVHVGRVNTFDRYKHFNDLGAHTCDGSGIARYSHMLAEVTRRMLGRDDLPLFPEQCGQSEDVQCI